jgi:hypothetical protein
MMFVNIVGHAIFHTAARKGPSTIDRSYRRDAGGAGGKSAVAGRASRVVFGEGGAVTSANEFGGRRGRGRNMRRYARASSMIARETR